MSRYIGGSLLSDRAGFAGEGTGSRFEYVEVETTKMFQVRCLNTIDQLDASQRMTPHACLPALSGFDTCRRDFDQSF